MGSHATTRYPFAWTPPMELPRALRKVSARSAVEVALPSGDTAILVTRYEDVRALSADHRLSRDIGRPDTARITVDNNQFADAMVDPDPPAHHRMRDLVTEALSGPRVDGLRPVVRAVADELLDRMEPLPQPADLNEAFAYPLPLRVICELLGIPPGDIGWLRPQLDGALAAPGLSQDQMSRRRLALRDYLGELIRDKRANPDGGMVSDLVQTVPSGGDGRDEHHLEYWVEAVLLAGYGTTAGQLGTGVAVLLHRFDLVKEIRSDWSLVPTAVEELLRTQIARSSVGTLRYATADIELADGKVIRRGSSVLLCAEAANLDADVFTDPFTIDVRRADNEHLTFGHGTHHCVGAGLARMQLQVAVEALLGRFPDIRLAVPGDELSRYGTGGLDGFVAVPVSWR